MGALITLLLMPIVVVVDLVRFPDVSLTDNMADYWQQWKEQYWNGKEKEKQEKE